MVGANESQLHRARSQSDFLNHLLHKPAKHHHVEDRDAGSSYQCFVQFTYQVGGNPLTGYTNTAPGPAKVDTMLDETATVTAGVAVKSHAAFYVYNTVKVITVDPVTDKQGNVQCAATSTGYHGDVFSGINYNAEAYFGGLYIETYTRIPISTSFYTETETITYDLPTVRTVTTTSVGSTVKYQTVYLDAIGEPVNKQDLPTGTMIALQTPFIYQAQRGEEGAKGPGSACEQGSDTEAYGYVPQQVLDYLVENQNPELASCQPGGPSIIQTPTCNLAFYSTTFQQVATDLTSSATIYVGKPAIQTPEPKPMPTETPNPNGGGGDDDDDPLRSFTVPQPAPSPSPGPVQPPPSSPINPFGAITNLIFGNPPSPVTTTIQPQPGGVSPTSSIIIIIIDGTPSWAIPGLTLIPLANSNAPAGWTGTTQTIDGLPFLVVPGPTATNIPAPAPQQPVAGMFPTTVIDGVPFLAIPAPTTIPVANAPLGLTGVTTTTINGIPYVVVASPTNIPAPASASSAGSFGTATINGTPFLIIPSPTPTTIPVPAPNPGTGTLPFSTTTINNTPFLLIPGPASIPLALAPPGLQGSTTTLNGTPFLGIASSATLQAVIPGTTLISASANLVIVGPTTLPVKTNFSGSRLTTVPSGTTVVVLSGATTASSATSTSTTAKLSVSRTSTSSAGAAPTGVWMSGLGVLADGVVVACL